MTLVLIVDDVLHLAQQYAYDLKRVGGFDTMVATGGRQALDMIASEAVDCVILDLEMPEMDGFEVLRRLGELYNPPPVIVYTDTGNFDRCMKAIRLGAYSFIDKTESMERVNHEVTNSLELIRLENEVARLKRGSDAESPIIGSSKAIQEMKEQIARVADIPSTVLITGESGTGKELVARELHRLGPGPKAPFVALNSAAIPELLVESELFGHKQGAFSGADRTRKGAFEVASGGTLFLDEIGEMNINMQPKLLRALEERKVRRIGASETIDVDTRVVAATNLNLEIEVEAGNFRQDLFFRVNVHRIHVPPLRDHRSDIAELSGHFLKNICTRFSIQEKTLSPEALALLTEYEWRRNNVRELRNIIERMVISSSSKVIDPGDVPSEVRDGGGATPLPESGTFQDQKSEAERRIIIAALERNDWQITNTAADLGLADHASLLKIMRRHDIRKK